jgi:hypothetical protein
LQNEKKRFSCQKTAIIFFVRMGRSMCNNGHRAVDELRCLKILRALHPRHAPDISLCDFWMFRDFADFKRNPKDRHLQRPEDILTTFQELRDNITFEALQIVFESGCGCAASLNIVESTFGNHIFTNRLFHEQGKSAPGLISFRSSCIIVLFSRSQTFSVLKALSSRQAASVFPFRGL